MTLRYPDDPIDEEFPRPPRTVRDGEGRRIDIERASDDVEELVEMYLEFDAEDRAQGIPPGGESNIREWLAVVMKQESLNVIGWHADDPVGHAMLVADEDGSYELAIFVAADYRGAGIGTEIMRTSLGAAQEHGIDRVWLSVERWNKPAIKLYDKLGFERMTDTGFELEMTIRLGPQSDGE